MVASVRFQVGARIPELGSQLLQYHGEPGQVGVGHRLRGAVGVSDRGYSAASLLGPGDIDWDRLFGELGVRCLHTGGIFTALSESSAALAEEAMTTAARLEPSSPMT